MFLVKCLVCGQKTKVAVRKNSIGRPTFFFFSKKDDSSYISIYNTSREEIVITCSNCQNQIIGE